MIHPVLPYEIDAAVLLLSEEKRSVLTEFRFRISRPCTVVYPWGEEPLLIGDKQIIADENMLKGLVDRATGHSPYAFGQAFSEMYLTLAQGWRMGICGEVCFRNGAYAFRYISSVVLRIAREMKGMARSTVNKLILNDFPASVLIISPPGCGKTTFLRDMIRLISDKGYRISLVDERHEIAAAEKGEPTLDVGKTTDILSGIKKAEAISKLIRVMNPQFVAVDELSGAEEAAAIREAIAWGVCLIATAHARSVSQLMTRKGFDQLLQDHSFQWTITLNDRYETKLERLEEV